MPHQMILMADAGLFQIPPDGVDLGWEHDLFLSTVILIHAIPCLIIFVVLVVIPLWIICKRVGISPYFSLLILVPGVNFFFCWIIALVVWLNTKTLNNNFDSPTTASWTFTVSRTFDKT